MSSPADDITIRRPMQEDAQAFDDFMIACDIAAYGEAESELETLLDD